MRATTWWIAGLLAGATGCGDESAVEGVATVTMTGMDGRGVADVVLYATADATWLATAISEPDGTASIGVVADSAITHFAGDLGSTIFGIDPGSTVQFPVFGAPGDGPSALVTTGGADFGGATTVDVAAGWGCGWASGNVETRFVLPGGCAQRDGAYTITALLRDDVGVVAYAIAPDVTSDRATLTLVDLATAPTTTVAAGVTDLPDVPGTSLYTEVHYRRKGQSFGVPGELGDARLVEADLADGLHASVRLLADRLHVFAEQAGDDPTAISMDGSAIAGLPVAASVAFEDGVPVVTIEDAGPEAGYSTYFQVSWVSPDEAVHQWEAWAAGPAGGTRRFVMPPVPAGLDWAPADGTELTLIAGYNQADFAPADYRLQPEPLVPHLLEAGMRSYAIRAAD